MDYYPTISAQETKNNKEINLDLNNKLVRLLRIWKIQALHETHTKNKAMGYIKPTMGYYPRNG